ncbi:alpha/beta fold hydrolase [Paraburkholderia caribensis]|uniref:alpha/beta fold hydrolase n=1 Tax=Paraburkholderia caribensis TaxID=75105 RepID=UPI001F33B9BC|nr:alpha/beta hydrolase [Paraburkholderia caribensis]
MDTYQFVKTDLLEIGYLEWNPQGPNTSVLVHGWPDSPIGWEPVARALAANGYRVLAPALRGFAPTRFLDPSTPRSGQLSALGRDLISFVNALNLNAPVLVGHDWGARAVANACALDSSIASHLVMLSVGYGTNDPNQTLSLQQVRNYWYHWYMATPRGEKTVCEDRRAFARSMWDTWSPQGWFTQQDFDQTATAFDGPDWAEVVLHSYRHRWGFTAGDPAYAADEQKLNPAPELAVSTLVLHGAADSCNAPESSAGREKFFKGRYAREVLSGVGHFPQREAPEPVARSILAFCAKP